MPLVTVLMTAYNEERWIGRAIESIFKQTFQDWHMVIVDDASTDSTAAVISKYTDKYPTKITLVRNKRNMGLPFSLNRGVQISTGKFIARVDADDECLPNRLEKQIEYMLAHPDVDVLGTGAYLLDERDRIIKPVSLPQTHHEIKMCAPHKAMLFHPSVLIRRSFFEKVGLYKNLNGEDLELWVRGLKYGCIYHNLQEPLIKYRTNGFNRSFGDICGKFYSYIYVCCRYDYYSKIPYGALRFMLFLCVKAGIYTPRSMRLNDGRQ